MAARAEAAVSRMMVSTSAARWMILATIGPIFTATMAPAARTATAAMPAPSRDLVWQQQDRLHMTACLLVDSVKHATHLFRMGFGLGLVWLAGLEGCVPSRPGTRTATGCWGPRSAARCGRGVPRRRIRA